MFQRKLQFFLGALLTVATLSLHAQMAQDPLLSRTAAVEPNIVFMFDDSGSMPATAIYQYGGSAGGLGMSGPNNDVSNSPPTTYAGQSPDVNLIYYDPRVTYARRINADGTLQAAGPVSGTGSVSSFNVYFYKPSSVTTYNVQNVVVTSSGSGYPSSGVTARFSTPPTGGTSATATVTTTQSTSVNSVTVNTRGSGYPTSGNGNSSTGNVTVTFSAPPAGGVTATGTVTVRNSDGRINSINITTAGSGYTSAPTITLSNTGNGSGATFTVNTTTTYGISAITVTNSGSGYTSLPTMTLNNVSNGSGAAFTVNTNTFAAASIVNRKWDGTGSVTTSGDFFNPYTPDAGSPLASGANSAITYPNTASAAITQYPRFRNRTDCISSTSYCTWAEEIQNYANWKKYHSTRMDIAKTGIGLAFQPLNPTFRLGWGTINNIESNSALDAGVRLYNSTTQQSFLTWLYAQVANGNTPNRIALDKVGQYYKRSDSNGPWADNPTGINTADKAVTSTAAEITTHAACRRSYALLMTDGYYNDTFTITDADTSTAPSITQPTAYSYTPIGPYSDTLSNTKISNTFADVAMKYWVTDLRPNIANSVKTSATDTAYWQHMNFYAIGLGIVGTLNANDPNVLTSLTGDSSTSPKRTRDWPTPSSNDPTAIDDMWHATVNGRGKMLNAKTASDLNDSINQMMSEVNGQATTQSGVAVSTVSLKTDTNKYTPTYTPISWAGNLIAHTLNSSNANESGIAWQVETLISTDPVTGKQTFSSIIPTASSRKIFVGNGATSGTRAVPFTYSSLNSSGLTSFMTGTVTSNLIDYLRGDPTNEDTSATTSSTTAIYRARTTRLGDIVNSTPTFVRDSVDLNYELLPSTTLGQSSYRAYVDGTGTIPTGGKKQRAEGVLFVGANDGMVHAFRDGTKDPVTGSIVNPGGVEVFAYVPKTLLPTLNLLADKAYVHQYFVDGPHIETDAYFTKGSSRWANVVIGTTGAGAGAPSKLSPATSPRTAIYAFDVTNINTSVTGLNASNVLWEISSSDSNFSELGYVLTDVQAGPTLDGQWVAIFGNGYESKSCQASLFVVNIETGLLIKEIKTNTGNCTSSKNGLGGVKIVRNAVQQIIGVYAGDLQGNLWKFSLNDTDNTKWKVDLGGSPLFTAGSSKSITGTPAAISLSSTTTPNTGYMVVAGTGKFFEINDITNTSQQSLYGIWDPLAFGAAVIPTGTTLTNTSLLVQQTIGAAQIAASGNTYYAISSNPINFAGTTTPTVVSPRRGWYIDFPNTGQRLTYPIDILTGKYVTVDTISPSNVSLDPCSQTTGGVGYFYVLDALTGMGPNGAIFDTNGDGNINSADLNVSGLLGQADGRNVSIKMTDTASSKSWANVSGGSPGATIITITCAMTNTCVAASASKIKSRTWRQLIMR
jgi:type IV pilus assembly protein PilY1